MFAVRLNNVCLYIHTKFQYKPQWRDGKYAHASGDVADLYPICLLMHSVVKWKLNCMIRSIMHTYVVPNLKHSCPYKHHEFSWGCGDTAPLILNLGTEVQEEFFLDCLTLEDGIDRLSRNVGKKIPFSAA